MNTLEAIEQRRSVKHYNAEQRFADNEVDTLLSAAMLSPTSFNIQNWRFVHVDDKDVRQQIRDAACDQAQVTDASLLLVLCADLKAWSRRAERY